MPTISFRVNATHLNASQPLSFRGIQCIVEDIRQNGTMMAISKKIKKNRIVVKVLNSRLMVL